MNIRSRLEKIEKEYLEQMATDLQRLTDEELEAIIGNHNPEKSDVRELSEEQLIAVLRVARQRKERQ